MSSHPQSTSWMAWLGLEERREYTPVAAPPPPPPPPPTHLLVCQHGLWGSAGNVGYIARKAQQQLGSSCVVVQPDVNAFSLSLDGVAAGGERLFAEICRLLEQYPSITHFSCIGYSLGGLYCRYAIGKMQDADMFVTPNNNDNNSDNKRRLVPLFYASMATPHLGSFRLTSDIYSGLANYVVNNMLGLSGVELALGDDGSALVGKIKPFLDSDGVKVYGRLPLLVQMALPQGPFWTGLSLFRRLTCYANLRNDRTVPYTTAAICEPAVAETSGKSIIVLPTDSNSNSNSNSSNNNGSNNNVRGRWRSTKRLEEVLEKHPHIRDVWTDNDSLVGLAAERGWEDYDAADFSLLHQSAATAVGAAAPTDQRAYERLMREQLNRLHFKKIDVALPGPHTHGHIVVRNYPFNFSGQDVVEYLVADLAAVAAAAAATAATTTTSGATTGPLATL